MGYPASDIGPIPKSNCLYNIIVILELKEVDTAKVNGELDYKHTNINNEDDMSWFDDGKRLNF